MNELLNNGNVVLNSVYLSIMLTTVVGGIIVFRVGIARTATEVQERVINALKSEIDSLKDRISELERENGQLSSKLNTMNRALRRRNMYITIDGELISTHEQVQSPNINQAQHITGEAK